MPRIYTRSDSFKADTTYHFRCEYCGRDYSASGTVEQEVKLTLTEPPTDQQFLAKVKDRFKWYQDHFRSLSERGRLPDAGLAGWRWSAGSSVKCPNCGFFPTYLVKRSQGIILIALLLIIGAAAVIPLVVVGGMPTSLMVLLGLFLLVPYLLLMWFLVRRLNPNRKLMRALRDEGRSLTAPQMPQTVFGPVEPK